MDKATVIEEVKAFREKTAYGSKPEDCFPAWYIHHSYGVDVSRAIAQSADPAARGGPKGYDFGIDAYCLITEAEQRSTLVIIQAKYSDSLNYIVRGFRDFQNTLPKLAALLEGTVSDSLQENRVIVGLRAALNRLDDAQRAKLALRFVVLHLDDNREMIVRSNTRKVRDELRESLEDYFPGRHCVIVPIGPAQIASEDQVASDDELHEWVTLTLDAVPVDTIHSDKRATMHFGVGYLAELVDLYNYRRDDLFSKNIRYFINSRRNVERGPSGKIRETLKQLCVEDGELSPDLFAFFHNGVTIYAKSVKLVDGGLRVREPFVLNGCQTIKTAYYFWSDAKLSKRIDQERWAAIRVPVRIVTTRNEDLIHTITVNTNRQNSISYAALRANDPVQIRLEERFRNAKIFYQRQEGAYANLEDSNPEVLEDEYVNSRGEYVEIVDLARSIAAVTGEIDLAQSPSHIFEYEAAYKRIFSEKRLSSVVFLTFLQNLHDIIVLVLKRDLGLEQNGKGPKPSRLGYYAMCLFVRYLAKNEMLDQVEEYGHELWGRDPGFRLWVAKMLGNYHSSIKWALKDKFLSLEDSRADSMKDAFHHAEAALKLRNNIDVFETFKRLGDNNGDET